MRVRVRWPVRSASRFPGRARREGPARTGSAVRLRARRAIAAGAAVLMVASGTSACFAEPSALPAVRDFLIAWQVENYQAAARHTIGGDPAVVEGSLAQIRQQLDAASMTLRMGRIRKKGNEATARFEVKVDLGENGEPWQYLGQLNLRRINGDWKVVWDPSIVHPSLAEGDRLAIVSETPRRAAVQDSSGQPLLRKVQADIFGVVPGRLRNAQQTIQQLAKATRLDSERLIGRVRSAPPDQFLPLLTLQLPDHAALDLQLRQVDGMVYRRVTTPIAPLLAPELVGKLGPAIDEKLQEVGAPYQPGDTIGVSGIQLLYQRRLAGIPAVEVVMEDGEGPPKVLRKWTGQPSAPVRTTLDSMQQMRAERALSDVRAPASLVAVHQLTGEVLAVANHNTAGKNLAFEGSYPPGMAFGVVSALPLLSTGQSIKAGVDCPATTTVGGRTFTNAGPARGKASVMANFANSCTTMMANLSTKVSTDALMRDIDAFGLGKQWGLPVPAFSGTVPRPANDAEKAEVMIGQGGVRVSPLSMALASAVTVSGTWRPPKLLSIPQVPQSLQSQTLQDPEPLKDLRNLMRRSVYDGTARAANITRTPAVYGVAATVNYTEGGRQKTVSWFVGFRDDLAFAIAVEGAVPASVIAKRFLTPMS